MSIGYLVNQYPLVSHSFIRREIAAVEASGLEVERFSIRRTMAVLVDAADAVELQHTRAILGRGVTHLIANLASAARRTTFAQALRTALRLGMQSDRGVFRHLAYLAEAAVLLKWVQKAQIRHVHAHFATNAAMVAMLSRMLGGPTYSFTAHGPDDFDRAPSLGLRDKIARATFVASVSEYGRAQLYRWSDARDWSKVHVIRPFLDMDALAQNVEPVPAAPRIVCTARFDEQKGHRVLLEAVDRLVRQGIRCELVLVGDGPLRGEIEHQISRRHLHGQVHLLGWLSGAEVRAHLRSARALVLPSFAENLPSAIMEAFTLHRPAVSTYVGGVPELIDPGVSGWLVPPGSADALAGAMREVLTAPEARLQQMGSAGAERVAEWHGHDTQAKHLTTLLRSAELA